MVLVLRSPDAVPGEIRHVPRQITCNPPGITNSTTTPQPQPTTKKTAKKMQKNIIKKPDVGVEPTTLRLLLFQSCLMDREY